MAKLPRRKCANKECRQWFHPIREGQIVCSYQCASAVGKEQTRKAREAAQRKAQSLQRAAEKKERAAWRQRKAAVKPLKHWIDLTQRAVNDICRETELAKDSVASPVERRRHSHGMQAITGVRPPPGICASLASTSIFSVMSTTSTNQGTSKHIVPRWLSVTGRRRCWHSRTITPRTAGRSRS